ncbi:MAG: MbnP family copper-binding protein, partial [Pseudomonadota bacterium]
MRRLFSLLILLTIAACGKPDHVAELRFQAAVHGMSETCATSMPTLSDLRFYVSEVSMIAKSGQSSQARLVPAKINVASPWQTDGVALVDLENGQGACRNGTLATNNAVRVTLPAGDYAGVQFTVGVPFDLNHANPLLAGAPLNDAAMHWHWRSGYKFLRAGVASEAGDTWIHLGSTGCEGTVGDISGCNGPNRVTVRLMDFDPGTDRIVVDLGRLLDTAAMLAASDKTDCSSGPAEAACAPPFAALGLPFDLNHA